MCNVFYRVLESFSHVRKQLHCLWQKKFLDSLFSSILSLKFEEMLKKGNRVIFRVLIVFDRQLSLTFLL